MEFEDLLKLMVQKGGSDLFITAGVPPSMKVNGKITAHHQDAADAGRDARSRAGHDDANSSARSLPDQGVQLRDRRSRHRPFPCQRLYQRNPGRHGAAPHRNQYSEGWTT
jgi:hypothetical protein